MLVKFLPFLLIIFQATKFDSAKSYPLHRIFHLSLDGINDGNSPCGLRLVDSDNRGYHISYPAGYYKENNFDWLLSLLCKIEQYEYGLVFFDRNKDAEILNNVNEFIRLNTLF
uniref:Uncharacterized protein n=1 Tax=Strongyloides venezuelensis TaxID=75913 RepID=A0A0K0FZK5_STRVS